MASISDSSRENSAPHSLLNVAIAGGGISGLITAIALLKHPGVSVQIYERAKEFKEIGASIGLGPNGLRSLEKLGMENALSGDVCVRQKSDWPMIYRHWKTGEIIDYDVHHTVKNKKHSTARYHRAHLHQALLENIPKDIIHLNKKTIDIHADPERGATIFFEDGSSADVDIVIGADGIHSSVRKTFVPSHTLRWTGWVALRATFDASRLGDLEFPEDAVHWIGHDRNFFHSHLGTGKGLFTTVGGFHADPTDPNALGKDINWDDLGILDDFKQFYKDWNPTVRGFIDACPSIRLFPNYAGPALDTWSFADRVTLVGDAAHTHGGAFAAGGSLAIDDAYALSLALNHVWPTSSVQKPTRQEISEVLQLYEATRKPHINKLLGVVHAALAGQRAKVERGKVETDEQLRERVLKSMDPWWISEHDVESAFRTAIAELEKPSEQQTVVRNLTVAEPTKAPARI